MTAREIKKLVVLYENGSQKIHGRKIWIFFTSIWFFLIVSILMDYPSLLTFWFKALWQISLFSAIYFLVCIYIYSKNFIITERGVYTFNLLKNKKLLKKSLAFDEVTRIEVKVYKKLGEGRSNGQIVFIKDFLKKYRLLATKIVVPIYDENPQDLIQEIVKKNRPANRFMLWNTKDETFFIMPKGGMVLGRECRLKEMAKDKNISRKHAEIKLQKEGLFITDLGSTNKTYVNGQAIPPHNPFSILPGDKIKIGDHEFTLGPYQFQKVVKIILTQTFLPFLIFKTLCKQALLIFLFLIFFFPFYIYMHVIMEETFGEKCSSKSPDKCLALGGIYYQKGSWNEAAQFFTLPCESENALKQHRPQACLLLALSHKHQGDVNQERNFLKMACDHGSITACSRLAIHTGNSTKLEQSLRELIHQCQDKKDSTSCKDLSNLSSVLKSPKDALQYLQLAIQYGHDNWYWIKVDPELQRLREDPQFKKFYKERDKKWSRPDPNNLENQINEYYEFLKGKYFAQYHPTLIADHCSQLEAQEATKTKGQNFQPGKGCSNSLKKDVQGFIGKVNSYQVINSLSLIHSAIEYMLKSSPSSLDRLETKLNGLDIYFHLLENLNNKNKIKLVNLVGNIIYFIKIRHGLEKKIQGLLIQLKNAIQEEMDKLDSNGHGKSDDKEKGPLVSLQKKLALLENKYIEYKEYPWEKTVRTWKNKATDKWEAFIDNEGDVKKNY